MAFVIEDTPQETKPQGRFIIEDESTRPKLTEQQIADQLERAAISSTRAEHPYLAKAADVAGGLTGLTRGALGKIADFGEKYRGALGMQPVVKPISVEKAIPTRGVDKESWSYLGGSLVDPAAWTIGGSVAKAIPYAPVLGKGFINAIKAIGKNVAGGTITGGAIGGLSEGGDVAGGATGGGAAGFVAPVLVGTAGKAIDRITGKTPAVRAKKVLQDVLGEQADQIRSQWRMAPLDVTASQAAYGSKNVALAALGERAKKFDAQFVDELLNRQKEISRKGVEKVAGGATQESSGAAASRTKQVLTEQTIPMLKTELGAANTAGKMAPVLQQRITERQGIPVINPRTGEPLTDQWGRTVYTGQKGAAQEAGKQYSEFNAQRQLALGKDISPLSLGGVRKQIQDLGWAGNIKRQRNANLAAENYATASDFSIIAGQRGKEAAFEQMKLDSLAAHGLNPINTDNLNNAFLTEINNPSIAGNKPIADALKFITDEVNKWTEKGGGIIDASAIDAIRRNGINSYIESFMGSSSDEAKKRAAAGILKAVKPHFVKAITDAGGTGYPAYLKAYEEGIQVVQRMKLGADALKLLDKNPQGFVDLIKGNSPEIVKDIFTTSDNIVKTMADDYVPLFRAATAVERDTELARRATAGMDVLSQILVKDASKLRFFPKLINWKLALAKQTGDVIEGMLNQKTMEKVYLAMRNGKNAEQIMRVIPAGEKMQFLNLLAPAIVASGVSSQNNE